VTQAAFHLCEQGLKKITKKDHLPDTGKLMAVYFCELGMDKMPINF
jgi:hypothetical protein